MTRETGPRQAGPPKRWTADDVPPLAGRTFVVTGANSGLGLATARQLARHGARVVMAVQFGVNHLGHFALTGLLLDALRRGRDARVVTVSSTLHRTGRIRFDDLTGERSYEPRRFYSQSKFANVLFGLELDRRLRAAGVPVASLLSHPGYAATNLQTTGPTGVLRFLGQLGNRLVAQDADAGARSQLYAATAPEATSGQFIGPDGLGELRGHPALVRPAGAARSPELARRLWDRSEELTGVRYDLSLT